MLDEIWGHYEYSTSLGREQVTWGALASEVVGYLSRPPMDSLARRTTSRGQALYSGDVPVGAESLDALLFLIDEAAAKRVPQPRNPSAIVFPNLEPGKSLREPTKEVWKATEQLLTLLNTNAERVSVVYGYISPLLPIDFGPHWGGELSGIRLPDDTHYYSLRAELGRLDLARHDPATHQVVERKDIRSWDLIRSTIGEIKICRQSISLRPLVDEMSRLVEALTSTIDETLTIQWEDSLGK